MVGHDGEFVERDVFSENGRFRPFFLHHFTQFRQNHNPIDHIPKGVRTLEGANCYEIISSRPIIPVLQPDRPAMVFVWIKFIHNPSVGASRWGAQWLLAYYVQGQATRLPLRLMLHVAAVLPPDGIHGLRDLAEGTDLGGFHQRGEGVFVKNGRFLQPS